MSERPIGNLEEVQDTLATLLKAQPEFARLPILTEKEKDIENEIERALGALDCGACLIVVTPKARVTNYNLPGPFFDDVSVVVRVVENVMINQGEAGTQVPASAVAELVAKTCHHQHTDTNKIILCTGIAMVPDESNLIYDVTFRTKFGV